MTNPEKIKLDAIIDYVDFVIDIKRTCCAQHHFEMLKKYLSSLAETTKTYDSIDHLPKDLREKHYPSFQKMAESTQKKAEELFDKNHCAHEDLVLKRNVHDRFLYVQCRCGWDSRDVSVGHYLEVSDKEFKP